MYRRFVQAWMIGSCLALAAGCAEDAAPGAAPDEATGDATGDAASALSVSSWSAPVNRVLAEFSGQLATLDGTTYLVTSGCGTACLEDEVLLFWQKLTPAGWSARQQISSQTSSRKVSLAAFNGFLYMVHIGESDGSHTLWMSRFDPATETWTTNFQLPYLGFAGPPAIVAFNHRLQFVGTQANGFAMWTATMTTDEVFSTATPIPNHFSASRPAATVHGSLLVVAHREGATGTLVVSTFDGRTWTPDVHVPSRAFGEPARAVEPVVASVNGFLHLVHVTPEADNVLWTYHDGCQWSAEVSIGRLTSSLGPSLTQGGPGLVLATTLDADFNGKPFHQVQISTFTAPPPPITAPPCGVIVQ
jgi:hypothetical protein